MGDERKPSVDAALADVMSRVRALDPTSADEAVRRFLTEILEAEAELRVIELDGYPLLVPYSPAWTTGSDR
jgi:hypothetical protein